MVSARTPFLMRLGWGLVMGVCLKYRLVTLSTPWKRFVNLQFVRCIQGISHRKHVKVAAAVVNVQ